MSRCIMRARGGGTDQDFLEFETHDFRRSDQIADILGLNSFEDCWRTHTN